ncbi:MAG TPA: phosphoribosylanthranilate isomerase [Xanthobacteraceae bacterium]|nr:phosphoribosylanthranilate isomerase [Xanthobacteraceae bacterium]
MSLIVKICGLSTPEALEVALEAGADMVGFVFFAPSPRNVSFDAARGLGERVQRRAKKVALSVDADDATLRRLVDALCPDFLQLHGKESPERVAGIKARFRLPVIKALAIEAKNDIARAKDYASVSDWLLFDAKAPADATRPGGLGRPFNWTLIRGAVPGVPIMLSGGLDARNVEEALSITGVPAVDVSSGVESSPGRKDIKKIRDFIRAARDAYHRVNSRPVASNS